ncbi:hypothetical protein [Serratia fonticola]|uniref:hypothetical protein n=1 Tax=Serratia fonticola TaxID=47917 RepID=UPI003AABBFCC
MSKITALLITLLLTVISTFSCQAERKEIDVSLVCENNIFIDLHYAGGYGFISISTPKETRRIKWLKGDRFNEFYILTFTDGQYIAKLAYEIDDTQNPFLLKIGNNNNWIPCTSQN